MSDATKTASQILFQSSLGEVVRKLRNSKKSEVETIQQCIADIKSEIASPVQSVKVTAVIKLTYFAMLGYSGEYGAFNIIEVMADAQFANKRAGYVAASLTFNERTDVLPLATALLKRDLASANQFEVGLALYCLASVCTPDLAKDLVSDVVNLLNSPRAFIRKKAVLCLYKIFLQYPESLRPVYPRLKEKLEDSSDRADNDPAVRGAIVSVLCEMARRNPANFLNLAVPFYSMLSTVHNNWTLIKIIKVFGYFAPLEPRLGKKLVEPITNLITTTGAKSVQYECIFAVANGMSKVSALTKLAAEKMKFFVEDPDQNLKYLGLDAMSRLMRDNPKVLSDQRDVILACLDDVDTTIRRKALELLKGMVTKKNLVATVNSMFDRCVRSPPEEEWSNSVIQTIIETVQTDDYANVQDFEWYTGVLLDLCLINLSTFKHGGLIERELVTVLTRVNAVRQFGVEALSQLLSNSNVLNCDVKRSTQWEVLRAAAFACGEYPYWLPDKRLAVIYLLSERVALLPPSVQVLCVTAAGKIFAHARHPCARHTALTNGEEEGDLPKDATTADDLRMAMLPPDDGPLKKGLSLFCHSVFPDVQESAQFVRHHMDVAPDVAARFYEAELQAVAAGAQEAVVLPEGLDLDTPFCDNIPALVPDSEPEDDDDEDDDDGGNARSAAEARASQLEHARRRERERAKEVSAFYIKGEALAGGGGADLPPVVKLDTLAASPPTLRSRHGGSGKKTHTMTREFAKPAAYVGPAGKAGRSKSPDEDEATRRLRSVDLSKALAADERLPEATPYARLLAPERKAAAAAEEAARAAAAAATHDSVIVHESKHTRVAMQVQEVRAKKEGLRLTVAVSVTNLATSSSLYDVTVTLDHPTARLLPPADAEEVAAGAASAGASAPVVVAERIKGTASGATMLDIMFAALPESFAEPLALTLTFTKEKKSVDAPLALPLFFKYFVAPPPATGGPSSDEINGPVLTALAEAPVLSAHVPIGKKKALLFLPTVRSKLRLVPIDIFKDCVSLHAAMPVRKATNFAGHVIVVLREEKVGGANGITILAKGLTPALVEAAVTEIAAILQE